MRDNLLSVEDAIVVGIGMLILLVGIRAVFKFRSVRALCVCFSMIAAGTLMMLFGVTRIIFSLKSDGD